MPSILLYFFFFHIFMLKLQHYSEIMDIDGLYDQFIVFQVKVMLQNICFLKGENKMGIHSDKIEAKANIKVLFSIFFLRKESKKMSHQWLSSSQWDPSRLSAECRGVRKPCVLLIKTDIVTCLPLFHLCHLDYSLWPCDDESKEENNILR